MIHMLKAWPSILASKSLHAREELLIPAFEKYFAENSHQQGSLLVQCRYKHNTDHGLRGRDIAATEVKSSCPVLLSTWQETLRYVHIGVSARVVMKDIMFDNKYLLKKGATVMTVTPVQHTDASVWGPTVGTFDHRRFLQGSGEKRINRAAFRSFGGGSVLCPGRHFVSTEVLSFAALLLLRFDLKPVTKNGKGVQIAAEDVTGSGN